ncbi:hypothetical protein ACWDFH_19295 [Streptomyces kronopolitis]
MALQLTETRTCDWHAVLPGPVKVEATVERVNPKGTTNDLCDTCALLFDLLIPRLGEVLPFLHPDALQQLFRVARKTPDDEEPLRGPAQLSSAAKESKRAAPGPKPAAKSSATKGKRKQAKAGAWKDDVVQVRCPLPHRADHPREYWVDLRNRTGHARGHKKDDGTEYAGPDVAFELQPGETFTHFCLEHEACAKQGGFGFVNEAGFKAHISKCKSWPPATGEARDATETRPQGKAA